MSLKVTHKQFFIAILAISLAVWAGKSEALEIYKDPCAVFVDGYYVLKGISSAPTFITDPNLGPMTQISLQVEQDLSPGSAFAGSVLTVRATGWNNIIESLNRMMSFKEGKSVVVAVKANTSNGDTVYDVPGLGGYASEIDANNISVAPDYTKFFPKGSLVAPFNCSPSSASLMRNQMSNYNEEK